MGTYCTADDVAIFMGLGSGYFTDTSTPTLSEVEAIIEAEEEYIDQTTGMAWREKKANDGAYEYHSLPRYRTGRTWWTSLGRPIYLKYRWVKPFDKVKGDAFEYYNGNEWEDWLAEDKLDGYTVDYDSGIIYISGMGLWGAYRDISFRVRYRYGYDLVPMDIKMCCIMLTASHLVSITDRIFLLPEGGTQIIMATDKVNQWMTQAERILSYRREFLLTYD